MTNATSSDNGGGPNVRFAAAGAPSRAWDEQSFSSVRGWPGAVCFHEQRLWLGGSLGQPDGIWSSRTGNYFDFDAGDGLDTDAIWVTVGSSDVSSVRHLVSNRALQVFTATTELSMPFSEQRPLTPSTVRIQRQSTYGASYVAPVPFDGATVFSQANGRAVREMVYSDSSGGFEVTDLTLVASHMPAEPVDLAYVYGTALRSEQYAFVVNADGTMPVFLSARAEKIAGWTLWTTEGAEGFDTFESICVIGTTVYLSVKRGTERWLEVFEPHWYWTLDGAQQLTSDAATTSWTLPADYRGKTVDICTVTGLYLGSFAVPAGGAVTLPAAYATILVGWDFAVTVETMPPDVQLPDGSLFGARRRIARIQAILDDTVDVRVRGTHLAVQGLTRPRYVPARTADAATWRADEDGAFAALRMDDGAAAAVPAPVTGVREFTALGYARQPTVTVTQVEPVPMRLLGLITEVAF